MSWRVESENVHIGTDAGRYSGGAQIIAIGSNAGYSAQGDSSVALGSRAGETNQGMHAVAIGMMAGTTGQGLGSISIGTGAGGTDQGAYCIGLGYEAGGEKQAHHSVAIGPGAGRFNQNIQSVAIGPQAMWNNGGENSVAIGFRTLLSGDGGECIAIGNKAMEYNGTNRKNCIAIGGHTNTASRSVALNATGGDVVNQVEDSFVVKPVRNAAGPNALTYNPLSGEITYATSSQGTKINIQPFTRDSATVLKNLEVKEFNYKNKNKFPREVVNDTLAAQTEHGNDEHDNEEEHKSATRYEAVDKEETHFGFIAEEVQKTMPELVFEDLDGNALDLKWNNLVAMLVREFQNLQDVQKTMMERIKLLERQHRPVA